MPISNADRQLMMETFRSVKLISSTGVQKVDNIIRGYIGIFTRSFPDKIGSAYIRGSYASGFPVSTSDIDLELILTSDLSKDERKLGKQLTHLCELISPLEISVGFWDGPPEDSCFQHDCLLVYGEDVTDKMIASPIEDYIRFAFRIDNIREVRLWDLATWPEEYPDRGTDREERRIKSVGALVFPLDFPDAEGEFFGYNQRRAFSLKDEVEIGIKDLVNVLYECIIPRVAYCLSRHIHNKEEAFRLYPKVVKDEWSEYVTEVWEVVRGEWEYRIPKGADDRNRLRDFCCQALQFENYYLAGFKRFWLDQIKQHSDGKWDYQPGDHRLYGLNRLSQVIFPDNEVEETLTALVSSDDSCLSAACQDVLNRIRQAKVTLQSE